MAKKEAEKDSYKEAYMNLLAKQADTEKQVKFFRKVLSESSDPELKAALQESSRTRTVPLIMDENRNYAKEIKDLLLSRLKGSKDPEFTEINGEMVVSFEDYGPKYKLVLKGPLRRIRPADNTVMTPRPAYKPKGVPRQ